MSFTEPYDVPEQRRTADYNPPSAYPGADEHDLPMVGAPEGSQWHNSEGLDTTNDK